MKCTMLIDTKRYADVPIEMNTPYSLRWLARAIVRRWISSSRSTRESKHSASLAWTTCLMMAGVVSKLPCTSAAVLVAVSYRSKFCMSVVTLISWSLIGFEVDVPLTARRCVVVVTSQGVASEGSPEEDSARWKCEAPGGRPRRIECSEIVHCKLLISLIFLASTDRR